MEDGDYFGVRSQAVADVARLSRKAGGAHELRASLLLHLCSRSVLRARSRHAQRRPLRIRRTFITGTYRTHDDTIERELQKVRAVRIQTRATTARLACTWHLVRTPSWCSAAHLRNCARTLRTRATRAGVLVNDRAGCRGGLVGGGGASGREEVWDRVRVRGRVSARIRLR